MPYTPQSVTLEIRRQVGLIHADLLEFPWTDERRYGAWLAQTYYYVRRVTHLLAAAASKTRLDQAGLHQHLLAGIAAEGGHEAMAARDLRDLGMEVAEFSELALTQAFYGTLFHLIDRDGPAALLGFFYALEGVASERGRELYERVNQAYGGRASSFLEEHVILDAEHFPKSLDLLRELGEHELSIVQSSCATSAGIYRAMLRAVVESRQSR